MNILKKYFTVFYTFLRNEVMSELEYRTNFFAGLFVELAYFCTKLIYVVVVIRSDLTIGSLGPFHIVVCIGIYILMTGIYMFIYPSFISFPKKVENGELDLLIIKPISPLFISTISNQSISMFIPNFILGTALTIYGLLESGVRFSIATFGLGIFFLIMGAVLTYTMFFIPMAMSFWFIRVSGLNQVLGSLWDFNNMPMAIFPKWIQRIGIYACPIFLISNPAALAFLNHLDSKAATLAILWPIIALFILKWVWTRGIKKYSSATS